MPVHLEKHVVVGTTSVILPGVYVGSPARKIKDRSKKLLELEKQMMENLARKEI